MTISMLMPGVAGGAGNAGAPGGPQGGGAHHGAGAFGAVLDAVGRLDGASGAAADPLPTEQAGAGGPDLRAALTTGFEAIVTQADGAAAEAAGSADAARAADGATGDIVDALVVADAQAAAPVPGSGLVPPLATTAVPAVPADADPAAPRSGGDLLGVTPELVAGSTTSEAGSPSSGAPASVATHHAVPGTTESTSGATPATTRAAADTAAADTTADPTSADPTTPDTAADTTADATTDSADDATAADRAPHPAAGGESRGSASADTTSARADLAVAGLRGAAGATAPLTDRAGAAASAPQAASQLADQLTGQLGATLPRLRAAGLGEHVLTLRVDPESFGPVRVVAHIGADAVRIELLGASDAAREALRTALPDLRRDLVGTGLAADLQLGSGDARGGRDGLDGRGQGADDATRRPARSPDGDAAPGGQPGVGQAPGTTTQPYGVTRTHRLDLLA